jgi:hypothetical protein
MTCYRLLRRKVVRSCLSEEWYLTAFFKAAEIVGKKKIHGRKKKLRVFGSDFEPKTIAFFGHFARN